MKKALPFLVALFALTSCAKKETVHSGNQSDKTVSSSEKESAFRLDAFNFPEEIQGCSCYFAQNTADFEAGKYIFADDMGKNTYLKIDGKMIKIPKTDDTIDPSTISKHIENNALEITLKGKKIKGEEEAMLYEGSLTVKDKKSGKVFQSPIYGECGC